MRIDAHYHVWRQDDWRQAWIPSRHRRVIGGDFWIDDWERTTAGAGFAGGIIVQTVREVEETPYLLSAAAGRPSVLGVVGWIDVDTDARAQLGSLMAGLDAEWLVGVRLQAEYETTDDWLTQPRVKQAALAVGDQGRTLDLLVRPRELPAAVELVSAVPDTRFVVNHLAKPTLAVSRPDRAWADGMAALADRPNVAVKVSGLRSLDDFEQGSAQRHFEMATRVFGSSRLLFGSDWPVSLTGCGYIDLVQDLERWTADWSSAEKAAMWGDNARTWYPLPSSLVHSEGGGT